MVKISKFKWYQRIRNDGKIYFYRFIKTDTGFTTQNMHRFIINETDTKIHVDHKDGNTLDMTFKNLRRSTKEENARNHKIKSTNTTGYKGVDFCRGKYRVRIMVNGKRINLGMFDDVTMAANAYDNAAKQYHGEFYREQTQ